MLERVSCVGKEPGRLVKWMVSFVLSWEEGPGSGAPGQHRLPAPLEPSPAWDGGEATPGPVKSQHGGTWGGTQPLVSLLRADDS